MAAGVLPLTDLDHWSHRGTALAVLGQPIAHSVSPVMHEAALQAMARTQPRLADWRYYCFEVAPADLLVALRQLHQRGFAGLNLTVPHKVLAVPAVEWIEPAAAAAGAVNTLQRTATGWRGYNTDGFGLTCAIREELQLELAGRPVILLGAGGAARGAAVECLRQRCAALWIGNRTPARLDALLAAITPHANGVPVHGFAPAAPPADLPAGAIVINATSAGLGNSATTPVDLRRLPAVTAVYDMVYSPPQTPLLRAAADLGLPHANGLSMLVHQGARALEIWTGAEVPVAAMRRAAETALAG
jgi:shikimate dehydrogenase